jgi:hypothetical protein
MMIFRPATGRVVGVRQPQGDVDERCTGHEAGIPLERSRYTAEDAASEHGNGLRGVLLLRMRGQSGLPVSGLSRTDGPAIRPGRSRIAGRLTGHTCASVLSTHRKILGRHSPAVVYTKPTRNPTALPHHYDAGPAVLSMRYICSICGDPRRRRSIVSSSSLPSRQRRARSAPASSSALKASGFPL